jgi:hypothetical protein
MKRSTIWFGRANAAADIRKKRQQLLSFLLGHGRILAVPHRTKAMRAGSPDRPVAAIACEMAAFLWGIGQHIAPIS